MFYVSRKVGRKYGVVDTSDGVEEFYYPKQLEDFYNRGIYIKGVDYIHRKFVVNPVKVVNDMKSAVKNKLIFGGSAGYKGFDLKFEGDKVITLPLTEEFFKSIQPDVRNDVFILAIPEIVTHIGDRFFSRKLKIIDNDVNFSIVLPESVKVIGYDALSHWSICSITFSGCLERVDREASLLLNLKSLLDGVFHVKALEEYSLQCVSVSDRGLYLPDIEHISRYAINYNAYNTNLSIYLGDKLTKLSNIIQPHHYQIIDFVDINGIRRKNPRGSVAKQLMGGAVILYFSDDSSITDIDLCVEQGSDSWHTYNISRDFSEGGLYINPYIFVMSSKLYLKYKKIFSEGTKNKYVTVGIITYDRPEGLLWLQQNLSYCCQHYRSNFKTYLDESDLGSYKILELK